MSNSYGIPEYILRQLAEQYLSQDEESPMLTGEQQNIAGAMPQYDLEGDPYTLTSQLNQLQDVNQLLADPMMQAGGGIGGFSREAFQPTVTWEQVDSPEYHRWQNYLNTPESFEGMIAAEIQGGGTPTSALRKIQQRITENPESPVAQQLLMFFPATEEGGIPTGEIDWTRASEAATEIDALRAEIPDIGPGTPVIAPDGTVVPGAGEIVEVDGRLLRRTEEPSELMQHFTELGLPSPYEEYTPESFLGPEWQEQADQFAPAYEQYEGAQDAVRAAMQELASFTPQPGRPWPGTAEEEGGGEGPHMVGDTDVPLVGNPQGIPERRDQGVLQGEMYEPTTGAMGGRQQPTIQQANMIQDPIEWLDWYHANANLMTDEQRMQVIANASMKGMQGDSSTAGRWDQVVDRVNNDMGYVTEQGGGFGELNLPTLPEIGEPANPLVAQAQAIHDPTEYRQFIQDHLGELSPEDTADLGAWAQGLGMTAAAGPSMDLWADVGTQLINGELTGTGGGEYVQSFMGPGMLDPNFKTPEGALRQTIGRGAFDASQTPGATFFPTGNDYPPTPPGGMSVTDQGDFARWHPDVPVLGAQVPRNMPPPTPTSPPGSEGAPWMREDWVTAEPPGDISPEAWRDYLLATLLPQYAVGNRASALEDEAIRAGQAAVRPRPTAPPGSETAPWAGSPTGAPGSETAPWHPPPTAPGSEAAPWGSRAEYLLPGIGEDQQIAAGKMAAARAQEARGQPLPDYLLPYSREAMLQAIMPNYPTTGEAVEAEDQAVRQGQRVRQESIEHQQRPPGVSREGWNDYLLSMLLPSAPVSAAAREGEQESVSEGARIRRRENLLPGITQDEAIAEGKRAAARGQEAQGRELPDYLTPYGTEFMLQNILPNYPATAGARELEREAVHAGNRRRSISGLQQNEAMLQMILPEMTTGERPRRTDEERRALTAERAPRGLTGERYEPTTGFGGGVPQGRRNVLQQRRSERARQSYGLMKMRQQTYGADYGRAWGASYLAQQQGITPLQQVYAQRMSNILNAGVPLGNQPQVAQY